MTSQPSEIAKHCLEGAEANTLSFPQIVGILNAAGFEGYMIDFRRADATYYLPDGETVELPIPPVSAPVATQFNAAAIQSAIYEAQQQTPDYSYTGFCTKVAAAGCAGYIVSITGRRVVYFGRTAEIHTEHFPNA
ncbi:MAG: DUF1398 family protein [Asticcacaulis sp.]